MHVHVQLHGLHEELSCDSNAPGTHVQSRLTYSKWAAVRLTNRTSGHDISQAPELQLVTLLSQPVLLAVATWGSAVAACTTVNAIPQL